MENERKSHFPSPNRISQTPYVIHTLATCLAERASTDSSIHYREIANCKHEGSSLPNYLSARLVVTRARCWWWLGHNAGKRKKKPNLTLLFNRQQVTERSKSEYQFLWRRQQTRDRSSIWAFLVLLRPALPPYDNIGGERGGRNERRVKKRENKSFCLFTWCGRNVATSTFSWTFPFRWAPTRQSCPPTPISQGSAQGQAN